MRKKIWCVFLLVVFLLMASFTNSVNAAYDEDYDSYSNDDSYSSCFNDKEYKLISNYLTNANDDYYKNTYYSDNRENIIDYDIEIHVNKDASMDVKEKITVNALGDEIRHGIYRDFPTQYKNKTVSFKINDVTLDDEDVKYTTESVSRGVRIKIGSSNEYVSEGIHTYVIDYTTERQMFFEEDYNELYWNLIGSGWNFDIEECSARIYFPKGTKILEDDIKAYVGAYGYSEESDDVYWYVDNEESCVYFNVFHEIPSQSAFTIVIRAEKGTIAEPTLWQRFRWFMQDNAMFVFILVGMIGLGIWQFFIWKKHGKDPEKNVIIPKYYPPEGMNVGDVKYMDTMGSTNRILEATLISLATKGFLKFEKENKKKSVMTIVRVPDKNIYEDKEKVSAIEREVFMAIGSRQELEYSDYFYKTIQRLQNKIKNELSEKYDNKLKEVEKAEETLEKERESATKNNSELENAELQIKKANKILGLSEVKGPGVIVTLKDSKTNSANVLNINDLLVHDLDVLSVINELKNAGAEAISINDQRIISTTAISCEGNVININGEKVGVPFTIKAIGLPESLDALSRPGGYLEILKRYGIEAELKKSNDITIPKYTGKIEFKYGKSVK